MLDYCFRKEMETWPNGPFRCVSVFRIHFNGSVCFTAHVQTETRPILTDTNSLKTEWIHNGSEDLATLWALYVYLWVIQPKDYHSW